MTRKFIRSKAPRIISHTYLLQWLILGIFSIPPISLSFSIFSSSNGYKMKSNIVCWSRKKKLGQFIYFSHESEMSKKKKTNEDQIAVDLIKGIHFKEYYKSLNSHKSKCMDLFMCASLKWLTSINCIWEMILKWMKCITHHLHLEARL